MKSENLSSMNVLVVDDQDTQRLIVCRKLTKMGHAALDAPSGERALEILTQQPIDLVISDWVMDGMDGVALCRTLRERRDLPYIYFILMSSRDTREDLLEGLNAGADDFLRKPLDYDELAVRLRGGQRLLELQASLNQRNRDLDAALAQINGDIDAAGELQKSLLPRDALDSKRTLFSWLYLPSARVSGDAVNCFRLDDHHVGFYNVDVAGHGVASAMVSVLMAQSLDPRSIGCVLRRTNTDGTATITAPAEAMAALNRQMTSLEMGSSYLTCTYGVLDERSGEVTMVRAGHTMPIVARPDGSTSVLDDEGDMPVGLFGDADFHHVNFRLQPGDRLCLYSDGVSECESPQEEEYGVERVAQFLCAGAADSAQAVVDRLKDEMRRWSGNTTDAFRDDVSMLLIEYVNGTGPSPEI